VTDRTVLVAGSTGRQGGAVARRLLRDGWRVRALTRHPDGADLDALRALHPLTTLNAWVQSIDWTGRS
jgi:uncharacterized protein YbjT (DUF2867 family)